MVAFVIYETREWKVGLTVLGFMSFMILLAWLWLRKLRQLAFDETYLYVKDFRTESKFSLDSIRAVNSASILSMDPFFEIEFYPHRGSIRKIDFLPPFSEHWHYSLTGTLTGKVLTFKRLVTGTSANKVHMPLPAEH